MMIIVTEPVRPDVVSEARSVLLVHRPDAKSLPLCAGCYEFACSFALWPCSQARWAQQVLEAVANTDGGELS